MGYEWVYRKRDFLFCVQGTDDPAQITTAPADYGVVTFPDDAPFPNPRTERADPTAPTGRRSATAAEVASYDSVRQSAQALVASRDRDRLAMLATVVRGRDALRWDAMTTRQQLDAIQAEAKVWQGLRLWIADKTVPLP